MHICALCIFRQFDSVLVQIINKTPKNFVAVIIFVWMKKKRLYYFLAEIFKFILLYTDSLFIEAFTFFQVLQVNSEYSKLHTKLSDEKHPSG